MDIPNRFGFGIVGPGMIASVIADAIAASKNAALKGVSSRSIENAQTFVAKRPGAVAVRGFEALIDRTDVQGIYVATPTVAKEEIALAAIAAGKHVLVDKPFLNRASVERMTDAATARGVVFMDATHFVHHPRTAAIQAAIPEKIGAARSLHTTFYFPFSDWSNIRFDPRQEPMTALGDMAWYSVRAIVEYLQPQGAISKVVTVPEIHAGTNAIVRAAGLIAFDSGEASTFDVGFTAGTVVMDLELLGTTGVISMDDFVLDWTNSWAFKNPDLAIGYTHRSAMATRRGAAFISTPATTPQDVAMIENFVELAIGGDAARRKHHVNATHKSQEYLDALWTAANS